jgi:Xaa-Pro aminopeptidase
VVLSAHQAALKHVRPGNDFLAPNEAAMSALAHGLERLGILRVDARTALLPQNQFHRRYTLHNISHMLGLDVHDCARARAEMYRFGQLAPGMVLTIEPGLYFQPDDLTVPAKYRGIGVRIEDDVLVTPQGCRILSDIFPRDPSAIEHWMRGIWKKS